MMTPTCGEPTKSGKPCAQRSPVPADLAEAGVPTACRQHETPETARIVQIAQRAYAAGERWGRNSERSWMETKIGNEWANEVRARHEARMLRDRTFDGDQIVEVDGYAYAWRGPDLAVGDHVDLPPNFVRRDGWTGVVTRLGSTYRGRLEYITRRTEAPTPEGTL